MFSPFVKGYFVGKALFSMATICSKEVAIRSKFFVSQQLHASAVGVGVGMVRIYLCAVGVGVSCTTGGRFVPVAVGGIDVSVGGTGVSVGGTGVIVGGTGVSVGGIGVSVGGTNVSVGGTLVLVGECLSVDVGTGQDVTSLFPDANTKPVLAKSKPTTTTKSKVFLI
jgi:hypothetical protein